MFIPLNLLFLLSMKKLSNIQKRSRIYIILFLTFGIQVFSQDTELSYPDPVFPDSVPRVFAPGVISIPETVEEGIEFSMYGQEIYFARKSGEGEELNSSVYFMHKTANGWTRAKKAQFSSDSRDAEPAISPEKNTLYFFSERRKPGITSYIGEIWLAKRKNGKWQNATYPQNVLNETWINSLSITKNGELFFSSFRNNKMGVFRASVNNGLISEPEYLPKEINSLAGVTKPFISRDGSILLFEGQTGGYGNTEIYISFKTRKGIWEPALKLNENINQTKKETNASLSPDGKYLFFTRNGDIYWVPLEYVF